MDQNIFIPCFKLDHFIRWKRLQFKLFKIHVSDDDTEDFLDLEKTCINGSFEHIDHDDFIETYDKENSENKRGLPRHHSEDSGVFDDEEDLNQQNLVCNINAVLDDIQTMSEVVL